MAYPKNPNHPDALGIDDVKPGVGFVLIQDGKLSVNGEFATLPDYDPKDGWFDTQAVIDGVQRVVDIYGMGIACGSNGKWADTVALPFVRLPEA